MKPSVQPAYQDAVGKAATETRSLATLTPGRAADKFSLNFCRKCGSRDLRREPATLPQKFVSVQTEMCVQCSSRHSRFQFSGLSLLTVLAFVALTSAIVYFRLNPFWVNRDGDSARTTAEALARARTNAGGVSAFEELMIRKSRTTMDNAAILKLWKARVSPIVIVKMIRTSIPDYDISANSIIELKQEGVDESVILAMIDATYNAR